VVKDVECGLLFTGRLLLVVIQVESMHWQAVMHLVAVLLLQPAAVQ